MAKLSKRARIEQLEEQVADLEFNIRVLKMLLEKERANVDTWSKRWQEECAQNRILRLQLQGREEDEK